MEKLMAEDQGPLAAVGVSQAPRDVEGSYMPCFLMGLSAAQTAAAALHVPLYRFSHQAGHVAAALYGSKRLDLLEERFLAFHLSGGTTECLLVDSLPEGRISRLSVTNDLNAGQVVDRVGGMLNLAFPAGPALEALALTSEKRYKPRIAFTNGNPCLSGVENQCRTMLNRGEAPCDIARFCLDSVLSALTGMADSAREQTGLCTMLFAGGVMSNTIIREAIEARFGGIFAPPVFSSDNAAGIAVLTAYRHQKTAESNR
jgi:N6-L-threonylcarbamoyladenine synthase